MNRRAEINFIDPEDTSKQNLKTEVINRPSLLTNKRPSYLSVVHISGFKESGWSND